MATVLPGGYSEENINIPKEEEPSLVHENLDQELNNLNTSDNSEEEKFKLEKNVTEESPYKNDFNVEESIQEEVSFNLNSSELSEEIKENLNEHELEEINFSKINSNIENHEVTETENESIEMDSDNSPEEVEESSSA